MRFLRILRAIIAILSLFLCLATAAVWIRSYFKGDHYGKMTSNDLPNRLHWTISALNIGRGGIGWHQVTWSAPLSIRASYPGLLRDSPLNHLRPTPSYPDFTSPADSPRRNKTWLGFKITRDIGWLPGGPTSRSTTVIVPFWSLALLFLLLSSSCFIRRRRPKAGYCSHCGYDLCASPDRCPECGKTRSSSVGQPEASTAR